MKLHFRKYIHKIQRHCNSTRKKMKEWFVDFLFKLNGCQLRKSNTKSKFYIPNFKLDSIQGKIRETRNYFEIENLSFVCKVWQNGEISKHIKTSTILDIGANIGNHSLYFLNECGASYVHAFEPIASTFNILKKNIKINKLSDRVSLHNYAVGSSKGTASISHFDERNIGGTSIKEVSNGAIQVVPVDILNFGDNIGLVKIDVEGFEVNVIKGMIKTIQKNMPYIMIEIRHTNLEEIKQLLLPIGYDYTEIHEQIDWWDYNDYLFFPKESMM